ncbi:MAG: hypothetical protein NTX04_11015 [Verrucomicrobia bacterium]|nr:hypothetical protein [Verrucomicrobiota bacterium]
MKLHYQSDDANEANARRIGGGPNDCVAAGDLAAARQALLLLGRMRNSRVLARNPERSPTEVRTEMRTV